MLTWDDAGPVAEWLPHGVDGWEDGPFKNVFRSTGFKKTTAAAGGGGQTCSPTTQTNGNATANGNGKQGTSSGSSGSGSIEANMDRLPKGMREVLERRWHLYEELHAARFHPPPPPKHSK
eukprot:COSAG06_NODE_12425_length_1384_cov_1.390661_3_plen_120_part_00